MRIWTGFKRELYCTDQKICLVTAAVTLAIGTAALLCSRAGHCFGWLALPAIAPCYGVWLLLWMGYFLLLGCAGGLYIGLCRCLGRLHSKGVICWALTLLCSLAWPLLFFGCGMQITALLLIAAAVSFGLCTLAAFAERSLLAALLMLLCIWWQLYGFLLTLLIILWN